MHNKPVTIRLLDPPLHEFLPKTDAELREIAKDLGVSFKKLQARNKALHEFNPMLGHRGCRLAITYPEIYEMQVQAIMEAACQVKKKGIKAIPEIMIPLIADVNELIVMREMTIRIATAVEKRYKIKIPYDVGTMIEIARAALLAHEVAPYADFYSFGTNDLTQTLYGLSRDDAGRFLPYYVEQGIFEVDPFMSIDKKGVGLLMKMAIDSSRKIKKDMKMGICGEQVDPESVEFCDEIGLTYVSGSPYRLPVWRKEEPF
jgi:pyruvate,orthophosphate dikinase